MSQGCTKTAAPRSCGGLEEREERRVAEVHAVDVGADLHARQAELAHAALELGDGEVGRLQRHRAEAGEARRVVAHDAGEVVVEEAREVERVCSGLAQ